MAIELDNRKGREDKAPVERPSAQIQPVDQSSIQSAKAAQNAADIAQARGRLGSAYASFLKLLQNKQKLRVEQVKINVEADYQVWAMFFEMMKRQFKDLWDFLGVVEQEVPGWFRAAPNSGKWDFIGISREGYNFAASIEQNIKANAPFPKKWLMVSLAHAHGWQSGIGDERMLGRKGQMSDELVGFKELEKNASEAQLKAASELKKKASEFPLVFEMSSDKVGRKIARLPVDILQRHSLTQLSQGLFLALNNDELADFHQLLPGEEKLSIEWQEKK